MMVHFSRSKDSGINKSRGTMLWQTTQRRSRRAENMRTQDQCEATEGSAEEPHLLRTHILSRKCPSCHGLEVSFQWASLLWLCDRSGDGDEGRTECEFLDVTLHSDITSIPRTLVSHINDTIWTPQRYALLASFLKHSGCRLHGRPVAWQRQASWELAPGKSLWRAKRSQTKKAINTAISP